jgi:cell division protein FtsL
MDLREQEIRRHCLQLQQQGLLLQRQHLQLQQQRLQLQWHRLQLQQRRQLLDIEVSDYLEFSTLLNFQIFFHVG